MKRTLLVFFAIINIHFSSNGQHSIAREWNEILLEAIRNDFARPTVHARNLFHTSAAMYDAWAAYDESAEPYLLGKVTGNYLCSYSGVTTPVNVVEARNQAMSYACYRILSHRFATSPGVDSTQLLMDSLMNHLSYDPNYISINYGNNDPRALGNYIAKCYIEFGLQDGSNEQNDYGNLYYGPVNATLLPESSGNPNISNPNRWQPLSLEEFVDQSGNSIPGFTPTFLSPEWGNVIPFALSSEDLTTYQRSGNSYNVYHDPGEPSLLVEGDSDLSAEYEWGFSMVSVWSAQLDPGDSIKVDISPGAIGKNDSYPEQMQDYDQFYNYFEGGDMSNGHELNPSTNLPYDSNIVLRGDYTRVLAEFWADGPDSETPPGHWFTLLNYVTDHPELVKKFEGVGEIIDDLEWDVKNYFMLGATMHDAAVTAWGIKGWYDYLRPVSAIRFLADQGQASNPTLSSYDPNGLILRPGYIELIEIGDPLAGSQNQHVGKIKLMAWKGPNYINDPETDVAGVDWIRAENWWPYQRPTFVTPPFAGYVSGHSVFSRAAAELLTSITGDPFFPGGMGEFVAKKNEFLVFEDGPSEDVTLQWATYRDASDQTSLSRIWGGIHPPVDDVPGRLIGMQIANDSYNKAQAYFNGVITAHNSVPEQLKNEIFVFPNPVSLNQRMRIFLPRQNEPFQVRINDIHGRVIFEKEFESLSNSVVFEVPTEFPGSGFYYVQFFGSNWSNSESVFVGKD